MYKDPLERQTVHYPEDFRELADHLRSVANELEELADMLNERNVYVRADCTETPHRILGMLYGFYGESLTLFKRCIAKQEGQSKAAPDDKLDAKK
jgi:hypothetical protein